MMVIGYTCSILSFTDTAINTSYLRGTRPLTTLLTLLPEEERTKNVIMQYVIMQVAFNGRMYEMDVCDIWILFGAVVTVVTVRCSTLILPSFYKNKICYMIISNPAPTRA